MLGPTGSFNFRDVGGLPTGGGNRVAGGLLYRAGNLDGLTDDGWRQLGGLGVRTVVDLRLDEETRGRAVGAAVPVGVAVHRFPMWGGEPGDAVLARLTADPGSSAGSAPERALHAFTDAKVRAYETIVVWEGAAVGAAVRVLAEPGGLPAVVHCAAGKDRTGLVVAVVLGLLGVSEQAVMADYLRSRDGVSQTRLSRYTLELERLGIPLAAFVPAYAAHPPSLRAALSAIESGWGSARGYLVGPGAVPADLLDRLRHRLTETVDPAHP